MGFEELSISDILKETLSGAVSSGRFPHASIFEDEDAERVKATALAVATALVCTGDTDKPCGKCLGCMKAQSECHPDIRVFTGGDTPNSFKVETVREIRSDAYIVPNEAGRKVYVLENANNMSAQAQNALLKVLEEPPEAVCFLLLTPDRNAFLQTVLSRCVVFSQGGGRKVDEEAVDAAKAFADALPETNEFSLMSATSVFEKDKPLLRAVLPELEEIFRMAVIFKSGGKCDGEYTVQAQRLAAHITTPALMKMMDCVTDISQSIDRNENYNLLITRLCADMRRASGR